MANEHRIDCYFLRETSNEYKLQLQTVRIFASKVMKLFMLFLFFFFSFRVYFVHRFFFNVLLVPLANPAQLFAFLSVPSVLLFNRIYAFGMCGFQRIHTSVEIDRFTIYFQREFTMIFSLLVRLPVCHHFEYNNKW